MKKKNGKINHPFNVKYTISFSGTTKSNGTRTLTPDMVKDKVLGKILGTLDELLHEALLKEYNVGAQVNHLKEKGGDEK